MFTQLIPFVPTLEKWAIIALVVIATAFGFEHHGYTRGVDKERADEAAAMVARQQQIAATTARSEDINAAIGKELKDERERREGAEKALVSQSYLSGQRCSVPVLAGRVRERPAAGAGLSAIPSAAPRTAGPDTGTAARSGPPSAVAVVDAGRGGDGTLSAGAIHQEAETCEAIRAELIYLRERWHPAQKANYDAFLENRARAAR